MSKHTVLRLRQLRREREITLQALANLVGLSQSTVAAIESGRIQPSLWSARAIAKVFSLPIEEVFSTVEVPE